MNQLLYNSKDFIDTANSGHFYFSYNNQDRDKELSPDDIRIEKQTDGYAIYFKRINIEKVKTILKIIS